MRKDLGKTEHKQNEKFHVRNDRLDLHKTDWYPEGQRLTEDGKRCENREPAPGGRWCDRVTDKEYKDLTEETC